MNIEFLLNGINNLNVYILIQAKYMWSPILDTLKTYNETNYSEIGQMLSKVTQYVWLSLCYLLFLRYFMYQCSLVQHGYYTLVLG